MTLARYFTDANEFLATRNHAGAAMAILEAAEAARRAGWTPPPNWARMTLRQRMEALGWTPAPIVSAMSRYGGFGVSRGGRIRLD